MRKLLWVAVVLACLVPAESIECPNRQYFGPDQIDEKYMELWQEIVFAASEGSREILEFDSMYGYVMYKDPDSFGDPTVCVAYLQILEYPRQSWSTWLNWGTCKYDSREEAEEDIAVWKEWLDSCVGEAG